MPDMTNKVLPSRKVTSPAGDLGTFPQTTAKNPSQTNGGSPPKIPLSQKDMGKVAPFRPDTSRPF
jgi:hypothetical protein